MHSFIQRQDICRGCIGLKVMAGGHHISFAVAENPDIVSHFPLYVAGGAERQGLLIVHAAVEHQLLAKVARLLLPRHAFAAPLNGIEHIDANLDQLRQQRSNGAVIMMHHLDAEGVSQIDHLPHPGLQ